MGKSKVVVLLGAGATKACGGPLTDEILPEALGGALDISKPELLAPLRAFLRDVFHIRHSQNYPSLPLFLSLVDNAISSGDQFHPKWPPAQMRQVREAAEYAIFSVLDRSLRDLPPDEPHGALM